MEMLTSVYEKMESIEKLMHLRQLVIGCYGLELIGNEGQYN